MHPDTRHASNEGPAAEGEAAQPHTPALGFGEMIGRLRHSWAGETYEAGADADGVENPDRRDEAGHTPDPIEQPAHGFTLADILPADSDPVKIPVELAAPVEQLRGSRWAAGTHTVGTEPVRLIGQQHDRLRFTITNRSTDTALYIAPERESLIGSPGRASLAFGETLSEEFTAELWVAAASGTVDVEVIAVLR